MTQIIVAVPQLVSYSQVGRDYTSYPVGDVYAPTDFNTGGSFNIVDMEAGVYLASAVLYIDTVDVTGFPLNLWVNWYDDNNGVFLGDSEHVFQVDKGDKLSGSIVLPGLVFQNNSLSDVNLQPYFKYDGGGDTYDINFHSGNITVTKLRDLP